MIVIKTNNDFTISTYPDDEIGCIKDEVRFILENAHNTDIKIFRETTQTRDITEAFIKIIKEK